MIDDDDGRGFESEVKPPEKRGFRGDRDFNIDELDAISSHSHAWLASFFPRRR